MTIQKSSWGYIRNTDISGYLTIEELLFELVSTVRYSLFALKKESNFLLSHLSFHISTNGNLLMNVGPTHDGRIMPIFQERLLQMGKII